VLKRAVIQTVDPIQKHQPKYADRCIIQKMLTF